MEVTISLKKALDVAKATLDAVNRLKINNTIKISIYASIDVEAAINEAAEKVRAAIDDTIALISTHYNIKKQIGELNDRIGVTNQLRQQAKYEAIEKRLVAILKTLEGPEHNIYTRDVTMDASDLDAIRSKVTLSRDRIENKDYASGTEEIFSVTVASNHYIDTLTKELLRIRRAKVTCSDNIAALNVNNKIIIDDADVDVLHKHEIL